MSRILELVGKHDSYRSETLNLQASENILSPNARKALSSDMASRYSLTLEHEGYNAYGGAKYMEELLDEVEKLACEVFKSKYSEVRPLGGHIAAEVVLLSLVDRKRNIMSISEANGGYTGYQNQYLPQIMGFSNYNIPYDGFKQEILLDDLERLLESLMPRLVVLGQSFFVKHYDLRSLRNLCHDHGCKLAYDGSHVMGLIAGGAFQPDVLNYVDVLFGSTHKSFFGPQGGIILTNDEEIIESVRRNITWRAMDNYNPSRLASLGVAMEEMRQYGKDYARKVVKNSFDLAKSLSNAGLAPRFSPWFTETHQILLSETSLLNLGTNFEGFSNILERNYIVVDREGRIGTSEISRLGIDEVEEIGELIVSALKGNDVSERVKKIRREAKIHYCEVVE